MKAICKICERAFKVAVVTFAEDSGVEIPKGSSGFCLIPTHDAVAGKKASAIVCSRTGTVLRTICAGSLKPPSITVH